MAIKTTGSIGLVSDIVAEFGGTAPHSISEYRAEIPKTNDVNWSDFYGLSNIVTLAGGAVINGNNSLQEILSSDYISDGGTLQIPANYWIWSDNTGVAALTIDTPNAEIINEGRIIGRGGNGASGNQTGGNGGPAIQVTAAGVTITNSAGAWIGGGGGGGGANGGYRQSRSGGGGGAGGGVGGTSLGADGGVAGTGGTGGAIGAVGSNASNGAGAPGGGGGAGGGGGGGRDWGSGFNEVAGNAGGGGGRILPGTGGTGSTGGYGSIGGNGGAGGAAGAKGTPAWAGSGPSGGGGGGWGAAGGRGDGPAHLTFETAGGTGGAAITGNAVALTNNGTIYGGV